MSSKNIFLRKAQKDDVLMLFCWVNDPVVRQSAFCTDDIPLNSHKRWFLQVLDSDKVQIFILQKGDLPIGQVRLELKNNEWIIDYSIDAAWRGHGYGREILKLLEEQMPEGTILVGEVKDANLASMKIFERLGYVKLCNSNSGVIKYRKCVVYTGGGTYFCIIFAIYCDLISSFRMTSSKEVAA